MAQPTTNAKIEELRFRIKADPKSRLFYPLAEELRKISQFAEAEKVLRAGLGTHATYLSAWVSLGRVLRDIDKNHEAVEALSKALQLDPGNVVAARLLGDAYLALGEKVEAIKKYKLVHALLPSDQEMEATIAALENEIRVTAEPVPPPAAPEPPAVQAVGEPQSGPPAAMPLPEPHVEESPFGGGAESSFAHDAMQGSAGGTGYESFSIPQTAPFQSTDAVPESPSASPEVEEPLFGGPAAPPSFEAPMHAESPFSQETETLPGPPPSPESASPVRDADSFFPGPPAAPASPWDEPVSERAAMPTLATPFPSEMREAGAAESRSEESVTGDAEPMRAKHSESPFEEPADSYSSDAFSLEGPGGMHIARAPLAAEQPSLYQDLELPPVDSAASSSEPLESADVEEPYVETGIASDLPFALESTMAPPDADDFAKTITMADLYAGQGLIDEARDIYEDILARDPNNVSIRAKLEALDHQPPTSQVYDEEEPLEAEEDESSLYSRAEEPAPEPRPEPEAPFASASAPAEEPFPSSESQESREPFAASEPPQTLSSSGGFTPDELPPAEASSQHEAEAPEQAPAFAPAGVDRAQIARLEGWLAKVGKREVSGV